MSDHVGAKVRCRQVVARAVNAIVGGLRTGARFRKNVLVIATIDTSRLSYESFTNMSDPKTFKVDASLGDVGGNSVSNYKDRYIEAVTVPKT